MAKKQDNTFSIEWICQIVGWILFVICAIFFLASGLKNDDILTTIGSAAFLIACFVFLYPLVTVVKNNSKTDD
jgi:hypothetical protein